MTSQLAFFTLAWLIFTEIGQADPLDTWTWRNLLPTSDNFYAITYGKGSSINNFYLLKRQFVEDGLQEMV
jgi:hypothetical protein